MRKWHPVAWIVGIIVVIVVALFFMIPPILSTQWGTRLIAHSLSKSIPGQIEITDLELHWMGPQLASGITLLDPESQTTVMVEQVTVTASLWALLWGSTDLGTVSIHSPDVKIIYDQDGQSTIHRALGLQNTVSKAPVLTAGVGIKAGDTKCYTGTYIIDQGTIYTSAPNLAATTFTKINVRLVLPRDFDDIALSLSAQAGDGHLQLAVDHVCLSPEGIPLPAANFTIHGIAQDVPLPGLDAIASVAYPPMLGLLNALLATPLNGQLLEDRGHLSFTANTPHLKLEMKGQIGSHEFSLLRPASMSLLITPEASTRLFPLFPRAQALQLTAPTHLTIIVPELMTKFAPDLQDLRGRLEAKLDKTYLTHPFTGPFSMDSLVIDGQALGRGMSASTSTEIALTRQEITGHVSAHTHTDDFLTSGANTEFELRAEDFPTSLAEPFVQQSGLIPALLGPYVSLDLNGFVQPTSTKFTISAESETLALAPTHFEVTKQVSLTQPSHIGYTLRQEAWDAVLGKRFPVKLREPATTGIVLNSFHMPLTDLVLPSSVQLVGAFAAPQIDLTGMLGQEDMVLNDLHLRLIGDSLADAHFDGAAELFFPEEQGLWHRMVGDTLPATVQAQVVTTPAWELNLPRILLWVQSRLLSIQAEAALSNFRHLRILAPLEVHYTLTPQLTPTLDKPADLDLKLEPWNVDLANTNWWQTRMSGRVTVDTLTFTGALRPNLKNLEGSFVLNAPRNTARADFSGRTVTIVSDETGAIKGSLAIDHFLSEEGGNLPQSHLTSELTLERMPTGALGLILGQAHLDSLIGPFTSLCVTADLGPIWPAMGDFAFRAQSAQLYASGSFALTDSVSLSDPSKPARLKWTLTPEAFSLLQPQAGVKLTEPTTLTAELTALDWPRGEASCCTTFDLKAQLADTLLSANGGKEEAQLRDFTFDLHSEGTTKPAELRLNGKLNDGPIALIASLENFFRPGRPGAPTIETEAHLEKVSVPWLLRLLPSTGPLQHPLALALGEYLSATATAKFVAWEGPVSFKLQAERAAATIDGTIQRGNLTLTHPIEGALQITPKLGSAILRAFNPLLISSMRSEKWATIRIDPNGFVVPLAPLDLSGLTIGKGEINLGRMWIARKGTISHLLNLFPNSHAASQNEIRAWATPAYFSAQKGDITVDRWDLLIDRNLQVASWGNVNLARNSVRLNLAIPGYSLRKVLNHDAIPADEYLVIPVRGTVLETKIDWTRAAAGVAAILARTQGNTTGSAAGFALDVITGAAKDKSKVPPPTTQPFPWATVND